MTLTTEQKELLTAILEDELESAADFSDTLLCAAIEELLEKVDNEPVEE